MRNTTLSSLIRATFCLLLLFLPLITFSQVSNVEAYKKKVYQRMANGATDLFSCSDVENKNSSAASERAKSQAISCATAFQGGYGTNCWNDSNTEPDPACSIPAVPSIDCNGGKYRIPIAITIFECFDWTGTNYLETEDGGFEAILNLDLNNRLVEVNELYANANIEFYEINRQRVQDCDLYDFYQSTEPSTGFNDSNDDLIESVNYDIPNAINIYFVGGLFGDHDCCGTMAFAPYPPGRDYTVLRYGTAIMGSNLAHELGHYFGLPHTYAQSIDFPVIDGDGVPTGSLDNCDCLTEGDRICDTWPDPSFSHNCNHLGAGTACYMAGGSSCAFDEAAYAAHILESHEGVSPNLPISPNSGTTFSTTSSTILSQNIMSNNFIFGCTTTFSPCQYKKIHDVARSDCRNYLCNANASDYFQNTAINTANTSNYEICIGDEIPTFQAGNTSTRFDGSQFSLDCFDWYLGEFDLQSEAILVNSSSFTPIAGQVNNNEAGIYEFWVAEVNALNDPPCKVKITISVADNPGTAITTTNVNTIDACTESNIIVDASGTSINNTVDIIGWYFSDANPIEALTTGVAAQTAIQSATNSAIWNSTTGNIVQSDANNPLSSLSNVSIDCNTLTRGDGTYFLTPFIAKGAVAQNCSTSSTSSSFNWNIAGGFTGGATVNLGPIHDCSVSGLTVDDFSITLNIIDCETVGGAIGAKIFFNRGTELSINTPFDFTFDCTQEVVTISGNDLRNLKSDYDPMVDQLQINFINTNFFRANFEGTIDLNFNARIDVNYSGDNAQVIWDANNSPNIDTSNMDCFWGDPITVLCDCENTICPEIGTLTGSTTICVGDNNAFLALDSIQNIGNFNMEFVYFTERQTDSSLYVNIPNGILGSGMMVEEVPYPIEAGIYYVYARLNPTPFNSTCRPFQELVVEVIDLPSAPMATDILYCEGDSIISSVVGNNLLWYDTPIGGDGRDDPMFNLAVLDTQSYWVSQTIDACESPRTKLDLIRVERPDPPNIPDVNLCMGDGSVELVEGISNLIWYTTETSTIELSEAPTINSAIPGTTTYWVSQVSNCESERVPVVVTVNAFPVSPTVEDLFYCLNTTVEPLSANGGNLRWYDSFSDLVGTDIAPTPRTDSIGVFSYMVSQTVTGCESSRTIINVTVSNAAAAPIVNNVSTCQGTPITLDVQGTELKWFESLTDSTSSDTIPVPMVDVIGIQSFWVSQIIDGCESDRAMLQVTIDSIPPTPIVSDINYFLNATAVPLTAIGNQLLWYTDTNEAGTPTGPTPATDRIGTQTYEVSQTINNCESDRVSIIVTVQERTITEVGTELILPTDGNNGSIQFTGLEPDTSYILSYTRDSITVVDTITTNPDGRIVVSDLESGNYNDISITFNGETFSISDINLPDATCDLMAALSGTDTICIGEEALLNITISNGRGPYQLTLSDGTNNHEFPNYINGANLSFTIDSTTTYTLVQLIGSDSCAITDTVNPITISVNTTNTPIVTPVAYCVGSEASPLMAEGTDLKWYTAPIGGVSMASIIPATDTIGIQQFWVSQTVNGCESARSLLEVNVEAQPAVPTVTNSNICVGDETFLVAEGVDLLWYEAAIGGEGFNIIIPSTDSIGLQQFWVSQTINDCESDRVLMEVLVKDLPSPPITTDLSTCEGTSILLTAEGENLLWYNSATEGSAMDSVNSDPNIVGTQTYWVSQTIDGCESARAMVVVSNSPSPPTPGVLDATYFLNETATPIMAFGNQLHWYAAEASSDGTNIAPIPNTSILGVQTYWVSQTIGDCESARVPVNITIRERVAIGLGLIVPPANTTDGSIQLTGLLANTIYTLIYSIDGNRVMTNITTDEAGNYVITGLTAGSYSDIRVVLDGQSSSSLEVMLTPAVCNLSVVFSANDTICPGEASSISIVIENGSNPYTLVLTDGQNLLEFPSYISGTILSVIPTTTSIYSLVSLEDSNGCTLMDNNIGQVTITIQETPVPLTTDITYCKGAALQTPLTAIGNNLLWYSVASGGVGSPAPPIPNTSIAGTTSYWVSQTINNCESARTMIEVTVDDDRPSPPIVESVNYCRGATTTPINAQGENLRWYVLPTGGNGTSIAPPPTADLIGRYYYWVSQTINGCESDLARIAITINETPAPEIGLVIPPSPCLRNGAIQLRNLLPNQNYQLSYMVDNRPVTPYVITTTNNGSYIFSGLHIGSYTDIKVQSGNCISEGLQQELRYNAPPFSVSFAGTPNICKGEAGTLILNMDGGTPPYDLFISDISRTYFLSGYESGEAITVRPTETTSYFLASVKDSSGCNAMFDNEVVNMSVSDCSSTGNFQNELTENRTDFLSIEPQGIQKSEAFKLFQNEPNPFSNQTTIGFYLPGNSNVELILRDNTGRIIKRSKEYGIAGINHILLDDLVGVKGLIYYQLITDFGTRSKKMLLVR